MLFIVKAVEKYPNSGIAITETRIYICGTLKMTDQELISYHKKATNQSLNQKSLCFYTGAFFFEDLLKTYKVVSRLHD
jgi:hypothetical protein